MILVDTNVWSEPMKPRPDAEILAWMRHHHGELALTSITIAELLAGQAMMPAGQRRTAIGHHIDRLAATMTGRIYDFDLRAARAYGPLRARLRQAGRHPAHSEDTLIAAIALAHGFPVATLNTNDFARSGVDLIDPRLAGQT